MEARSDMNTGLPGAGLIMGVSGLSGLTFSAANSLAGWLDISPGVGALVGTVVVGVFGVVVREAVGLYKWRVERRDKR